MTPGAITTEALAVLSGKALTWTRRNRWYVESDCRRYLVSKARVSETPRYTAWLRHDDGPPESLGMFDSAAEAKARCAEHQEAAS